jgi:3-methyladenine DNA glycosylase AlkC
MASSKISKPAEHIDFEALRSRVGARRRSEVPTDVLDGLHLGRLETVNLVEWLAIDQGTLLSNVLTDLEMTAERDRLLTQTRALADEGVNRKIQGIAEALHAVLAKHRRRKTLYKRLMTHPSDVVRSWSANIIAADKSLALADRLDAIRPLAADSHFGVRESAWMALRPFLAADLEQALSLLLPWTKDTDPNLRRFAIESTRPRGVWCAHIQRLREQPEDGLILLEPVRSDPSRYVQLSVANWLNDASKTRPDWTKEVCQRWLLESPTEHTRWIVHHAMRTLRKGGSAQPEKKRSAKRGRS